MAPDDSTPSVMSFPVGDTHQEHWLLLDSASLYFRAFFGVPSAIVAPDGTQVNAVRGFLDMIATLVETYRPTHLVACWDDDWRPQWRVDLLPSYKTHRAAPQTAGSSGGLAEDVPDALSPQVPIMVDLLTALGIARVGAHGCEADDVIGTLATRLPRGATADIVTGDRDLFQLVDDERGVRVLYTGKGGVRSPDVVDQAWLTRRYGVFTGDAYADLAVLRGDPSDGLPGVAGIGEKTAATLVGRFGSLQGILTAAVAADRGVTQGQRLRLAEAADYLRVAPGVVAVLRDADLPEPTAVLPFEAADSSAVQELAQRWGVGSSVDRVLTALAGRAGSV